MDFANHWSAVIDPQRVRQAVAGDSAAIQQLLQTAAYRHLHVDWYLPGDWLGSPGFVVLAAPTEGKKPSVRSRLFGARPALSGCLAVAADPLPAAWVRVVALGPEDPAPAALAAQLAAVIPYLEQQGGRELAWLAVHDWINPLLPALGFTAAHAIETYERPPQSPPPLPQRPDLLIRPAQAADFPRLEEIEAAAFAPIWRHSARALAMARPQTISFDVVEQAGHCIGYQMSTAGRRSAHLVRMTLDPPFQQQGIGAYLLTHTMLGYRDMGWQTMTLNTQTDNIPSQKLYEKFGFRPTGHQLPIWVRPL